MKNTFPILMFALFMLTNEVAFAQKGWKYSLYVVPQYTTMRNADDLDQQADDPDVFRYDYLWGLGAGGSIGYNPSENFGMKVGLLYNHQGYRYTSRRDYLERYRFVTRLDYLKMPLMFGVHSNYLDNKAVFSFYAGYQLGFLLGGQQYDNVKEYQPGISPNISRIPSLRRAYDIWDNSIVMESGLDFMLDEVWSMNLKARFDYGLTDAENKLATKRITEGGETFYVDYWPEGRRPAHNITMGLLIGVTYNIIPPLVLRKPMPEKVRKTKPAPTTEEVPAENK